MRCLREHLCHEAEAPQKETLPCVRPGATLEPIIIPLDWIVPEILNLQVVFLEVHKHGYTHQLRKTLRCPPDLFLIQLFRL